MKGQFLNKAFHTLTEAFQNCLKRFPTTVCFVLALTAYLAYLVSTEMEDERKLTLVLGYYFSVGTLLSLTLHLWSEEIKNRIKELDDDSVIVVLNREFNTDSLTRVKVERGLFVEGDNEKIDELVFKGAPVKADEKLPIAFVSGKLLKKMPEAYTDVRGQVTADYQTYLEKVWVKKLNKKYPVEIYEDVLKTVNRP